MLNHIIAFSLRNRVLVVVAALVVAVLGGLTARQLPIDVLPDLNRPRVTIMTEAHGMVPVDVEQLVTRHIEQSVSGATGVMAVRSQSMMGLSVVQVEFDWGTDIYNCRQVVQEKLQLARSQLPPEALPQMSPISSLMGQVQLIGVIGKEPGQDITEIRAQVDQVIRLRLLAVSGVAQVLTTGGTPRQLQVILSADKLRAYGVDLPAVANALKNANVSGSGGVLPAGTKGPWINVTGLVDRPEDLARVVVRPHPKRPILLSDLAEIDFGPAAVKVGEAGINGKPGVILVVFKQPGVDTMELTQRIDDELEKIQSSLPQLEILPGVYRQADFIRRAVDNVTDAVIDGAILVVIVLFLFLMNLRTTFITLTAIPLSIAVTALVFHWMGVSINTMTLGGLAVAIGALVDDAIVDVENVFRRLRQNKQAGLTRAVVEVVFRASSEVRRPILIGTLVVTSVYVPLFALSGLEGRLFTPIGIAYIVSILASLLVSLTVTPVLCYYLLPQSKAVLAGTDGFVVRHLKTLAAAMIGFSIRFPVAIVTVLGGLVITGLTILLSGGSEFLPEFNEGTAQVNLALPPGTSIDTTDKYGRRLEEVVRKVSGVQSVGRRTGRAEQDEHVMEVNVNEMIVTFDPDSGRSRGQMLADIRHELEENFPGFVHEVEQPLGHLISHLLSGVTAQVAIKVQGGDLTVLRRIGKQVEAAIEDVDGVTDLFVDQQVLVPQVEVRPNRRALAAYGLSVRDVADTVELALEGAEVSRFNKGLFSYPIILRLRPEDRQDLHSLENLPLPVSDPADPAYRLSVGDLADVGISRTANRVDRDGAIRTIVVQHNVAGRSLGEVAGDVDRILDTIRKDLPAGYSIRLAGQFEAQERAAQHILLLSFVSIAIMGLVLFSHFRSHNLVLQTLLNIPTAFVGAVAFVLLSGQAMSVATLVGLISLGGIAARNKILLLDHYLHLMAEEGAAFSKEMIVRAGQERIVPVLMTALTSGIALMPLVLSPDEPGRELLYPVASVIVGGLVSTTLLDLLLSPGVFWLFGRHAAEQVVAHGWAGAGQEDVELAFD